MSKKANAIKLSEEEDAIIYYEKVLGKNITIQKRAAVIYYASKGINTITEILLWYQLNLESDFFLLFKNGAFKPRIKIQFQNNLRVNWWSNKNMIWLIPLCGFAAFYRYFITSLINSLYNCRLLLSIVIVTILWKTVIYRIFLLLHR